MAGSTFHLGGEGNHPLLFSAGGWLLSLKEETAQKPVSLVPETSEQPHVRGDVSGDRADVELEELLTGGLASNPSLTENALSLVERWCYCHRWQTSFG